jgi:membrane associated rhomboid family serine protease
MFPLRDDNPTFLTPYATYAIIGLNVLVWVVVQGLGNPGPLIGSFCSLALIPAKLLEAIPVGTVVAFSPDTTCVLAGPAWYTPLTSMFMHGGWLHIVGNLWFLWIFGNNVEDSMGTLRFATFYVICGLAAAALQVLSDPGSAVPMVGASGAIGGVMGAYIVLFPKVRVHMLLFLGIIVTTIAVPAYMMLGYWIVVQLIQGFGSVGGQGGGVAFWAHVGGFVAGAALIFLFRDPKLLARHPYYGWRGGKSPSRSWRRIDRR